MCDSAKMEVEWSQVRQPGADRAWQDVLRPIASELRAAARGLAAEAVAYQQSSMPEQFPDAMAVEANRDSVEADILLLADVIERGLDPRVVELSPSALAVGRSGVRRQASFAALMRFYRLGQEVVLRWIVARIMEASCHPADRVAALDLAVQWIFAYVDVVLTQAEQAYEAEHEAWVRGAAAARAAAIHDVLTGAETNQSRASTRLGHELGRSHVALIAWTDAVPGRADAQQVLADAIAAVCAAFGVEGPLLHPSAGLSATAWLSRKQPFTSAELENVSTNLQELAHGVRLAIGEPGRALDGFRRSYREAEHARRVAALVGDSAGQVVRFQKIAVAALGTVDRDLARTFVSRVLGPLAADDEATFRVAMTLSAFLDENRSRIRAAERLMVHPNTVSYRVRQAEEILGRPIDVDSLDLQVALTILPTLPRLTQ